MEVKLMLYGKNIFNLKQDIRKGTDSGKGTKFSTA